MKPSSLAFRVTMEVSSGRFGKILSESTGTEVPSSLPREASGLSGRPVSGCVLPDPRGPLHGSRLHFPAAPAAGGAGGWGRLCERRRGRRAPGTRAGDHGVRPARASTLTPGGDGSGGGEGASLERAGPGLREGRKGRGERRREAGRPRAGGQRSAAPSGARGSMRRPRDHGLQDQVSAAGRRRAGRGGGEAGLELQAPGRAWGTCCLDLRGAPRGGVKRGGGRLPWRCGEARGRGARRVEGRG